MASSRATLTATLPTTLIAARPTAPVALAARLCLGLSVSLLTAGCGDDSDAPATTTTTSSEPDPTPRSTIVGALTYERVPHLPGADGLDYAATARAPIRAARVELLTEDGALLAETASDDDGHYTIDVPERTRARIRVYAESLSPPIVIEDNTASDAIYTLESALLDLADEVTLDLTATTGWGGDTYTGVRAAAPFALLDTALTASRRFIAAGASPTDFPPLHINWSPDNRPEDGSIQSGRIGTSHWDDQELYILGDDGVDTDEFDTHVLVHEWGHYYESRLSRTDSPGGGHGYGDLLDPRVALSEGWGNALSAMILDPDTTYRDTQGPAQASGFSWDVDANDTSAASSPGWYSETTIEAVLLDLYDGATAPPEPFDTVALGLGAIHEVMTQDLRQTPALTTLFSFIAALKARHPGDAAAIDTLVAHHRADSGSDQLGIDPVLDVWGTGETHSGGLPGTLPVYVDAAPGDTLALTLVGGADYNALAQNRYVRLNATGPSLTVRSSATQDVDLLVYQRGDLLAFAVTADGNELVTVATQPGETYVINVQGYGMNPGTYPVSLEITP
ncbi:Hypothetical protein CAP_8489 [Chondromyces apiculatus DSM 436]|uniref:Lipoprotein n=2 Tax=Chondromyces apiculatus TaxID=51 RepID=A0A017SY60_9BACT|nr:Hypothetical protein CAP_8489 [Chondromyces apiculatus DSM 436]